MSQLVHRLKGIRLNGRRPLPVLILEVPKMRSQYGADAVHPVASYTAAHPRAYCSSLPGPRFLNQSRQHRPGVSHLASYPAFLPPRHFYHRQTTPSPPLQDIKVSLRSLEPRTLLLIHTRVPERKQFPLGRYILDLSSDPVSYSHSVPTSHMRNLLPNHARGCPCMPHRAARSGAKAYQSVPLPFLDAHNHFYPAGKAELRSFDGFKR